MTEKTARIYYQLDTSDLGCLRYFLKPIGNVGKTIKVFKKQDVKFLLYRKVATLAGIEEIEDNMLYLRWGEELAREALLKREELWYKLCAHDPRIQFPLVIFMTG